MPALDVNNSDEAVVAQVAVVFHELLERAKLVKQSSAVDPALNRSQFKDIQQLFPSTVRPDTTAEDDGDAAAVAAKTYRFSLVETAARKLFEQLISSTPIESSDFVNIWNLLDIVWILEVEGLCDPALLVWLIEDLLDSQTIAGCRKIFNFLESRRERITARQYLAKNMVILRSCNQLLRRLSRAEDTGFCGRVFIFLFQSFPLGDRSSVNLRGEYHTENVTTYEQSTMEEPEKMQVDGPNGHGASNKGVLANAKDKDKKQVLQPNELYPSFWSLQDSFSQPLRLLDQTHFGKFKASLDATMTSFEAIVTEDKPRAAKPAEDSRRTLKRKRDDGSDDDVDDGTSTAFNPKYLTSRDLFELEISDISFRRNVLVQAWIIMDFLLSLSVQAKKRLERGQQQEKIDANPDATKKEEDDKPTLTNKSVIYSEQLSEDDAKWVNETKSKIEKYLRSGSDGPYFHRMVETVLVRDKNWVIWKMKGCPAIQREPIPAAGFHEAQSAAQRMATSKRLRPTPMGAVALDFLETGDKELAMHRLQDTERYQLPELDYFKSKIADDDFEIAMPTNDETRAAAVAGKASKSWRALRIASRYKLAAFDKIDDPKKVDMVFEELTEAAGDVEDEDPPADEDSMPKNREPIIIAGPSSAGKSSLINELLQQHKGVFALVVRHTTREPRDGEINGKDYHFVKSQEFNQLRDGDRLIEYGTRGDVDYGTSSKAIEAITETGKIPLLELDIEAAQFAKDMDFTARFVLIKPPSEEALLQRLETSEIRGDAATAIVKTFTEIDVAKTKELFDKVIVNTEVASAAKEAQAYIYETQTDTAEETPSGEVADGNGDVAMAETAPVEELQEAKEGEESQKPETGADTPAPEVAAS